MNKKYYKIMTVEEYAKEYKSLPPHIAETYRSVNGSAESQEVGVILCEQNNCEIKPMDTNVRNFLMAKEAQYKIRHLKTQIRMVKQQLKAVVDGIEDYETIGASGKYVLLKSDGDTFKFVAVVDPDNDPKEQSSEIEDWDIIIPIPNPITLVEFGGF